MFSTFRITARLPFIPDISPVRCTSLVVPASTSVAVVLCLSACLSVMCQNGRWNEGLKHTSIAFRHLPPNSARFCYATEGALFISAQLSIDAVSALRKVWVIIITTSAQSSVKQPRKHDTHPPRVKKKKSSVSIQTIVVLYELV